MRNSQTPLPVRLRQAANAFLPAVLLILSALTPAVQAAAESTATQEELQTAVAQLLAIRPDLPIEAVYPTQVDGLFGADLPDGNTLTSPPTAST